MTSKVRILLGFTLLTMFTIVLGVMSYNASKSSIEDLTDFVRFDKADTLTFEVDIEMRKMTAALMRFNLERKNQDRQVAIDAAQAVLEDTKALTKLMGPEDASQISKNINDLESLIRNLNSFTSNVIDLSQKLSTKLLPAQKNLGKALVDFSVLGVTLDDPEIVRAVNFAQSDLIYLSENMVSFLLSQNASYLDASTRYEEDLNKYFKYFATLRNNANLTDFTLLDALEKAFGDYMQIAKSIQDQAIQAYKQGASVENLRDSVLDGTVKLSSKATASATQKLQSVMKLADSSSSQMLILACISTLVSICVVIFIIVSLSRVLDKMAHYAQRIAQGEFNYNANISEKGEIGLVVSGINDIATILTNFKDNCYKTANDVSIGKLAAQLDDTGLQGNFKDLAATVNTLLKSYSGHLDTMAVGILTGTPNCEILYMNKTAKKMVQDENVVGAKCGSLFNAPCCDNPNTCLGRQALGKRSGLDGETPCYPKGQRMDISVFAIPVYDLSNKAVGYMEFFTDVSEIRKQTQAIQDLSSQATEVAIRVASAAEELSAQTEHIVEGSNFQRERIESTSTAMAEMNSSVMEVASHAADTAQQSDSVRQKANEGIKITIEMASAMGQLSDASENLKNNMGKLDNLSEGIGSIINVISDIADQTNLLALNAAIEAARAGEAGRGFAVVADEVRKLAEKTMDATREVDESVRSIQVSSRSNQQEVTKVVEQISHTAKLAQQSEVSLKEIVDVTSQNTEMIHLIASAAGQQTTVSNEISQSMSDINEVVNKNASAILQSAEAIRELTQQAQELQDFMGKVK